jgi:N-methylhydantoinase A
MTGHALAVDIGGTFTDVVLRDADGRCWVDKTLTTPSDLLEGFFAVVELAMAKAGTRPQDVDDIVVHATTIVTNALIERKGPPTGLLVTEGFGDVLFIRDEHRYDMYDPLIEFPEPLVPRERTFGVGERVLADGSIETAVDEGDVVGLAGRIKAAGIQSVAVCFLNAYKQPANEQRVGEILARELPDLHVSLSSDVAPQMREYLRASTTVVNAYTQPITRPYLTALRDALKRRGYPNEPLIMLSNGGIIGADIAGRFPVRMIESGPAAGALVASYYAEKLGIDDLLSFDMGGTTAKACLIQHRQPLVAGVFEVDRQYRFKPGSGFPVTVPSIDMIEVGAGGGSIARVDALGLMKVGPDSAGSEPGPVCYDRGGTHPTVTDADLILGYLDAGNFLGGDMQLDVDRTTKAMATLGEQLNTNAEETALGVYQVVGEQMAAAARAHATDRGIDPRGLPVLAFGGAGPVHANHVAELLDSDTVIYPPLASVLSAFGTLVTPVRLDLVRGALVGIDAIDWDAVTGLLNEIEVEAGRALGDAGIAQGAMHLTFGADMRYRGQANEVTVDFPSDPRQSRDTAELRRIFEASYERLYGLRLDDIGVEVVSWRVTAVGPSIDRQSEVDLPASEGGPKSTRRAVFGGGAQSVDVYDRAALAQDQHVVGPAIVEERETTIVILPGWEARVDRLGCIVAKRTG